MNEYLMTLKNKFDYSDELINFLGQLIPTLIKYYGEEHREIILSTLSNCEIHFQRKDEDPKTFLNSYFNVNKEWKIPFLAGAFYHNEIIVKDNQVFAKPIIYLKQNLLRKYTPFDFNDDNQLNTLIHEICHSIKGYGKVKVQNGKIIDSSGLSKDTYSYSQENGVVEEKNDMVGIEEALNTAETTQILEMMTGRKQEIIGYRAAGYFATQLLQHSDITKVIRASQFSGDDSWIQYIGEEQSKLLIENFDILVNSLYVSHKDINTPEKRQALFDKMELAQDVICKFIDNYCSKEDVDAFTQSLEIADKKTVEMAQQIVTIKPNTEEVSSPIKK